MPCLKRSLILAVLFKWFGQSPGLILFCNYCIIRMYSQVTVTCQSKCIYHSTLQTLFIGFKGRMLCPLSRFIPKRLSLWKLFGFKLILLLCIRLMRDLIGQEHSITIQEQRKLT